MGKFKGRKSSLYNSTSLCGLALATVVAVGLIGVNPAKACGGPWDVACNVGNAVGTAVHQTGTALAKPAEALVKQGENVVKDSGKVVEKAVQDTGKGGEKAIGDSGKAIEKTAGDIGKGGEKAIGDSGKAIEKTAHDIGHSDIHVSSQGGGTGSSGGRGMTSEDGTHDDTGSGRVARALAQPLIGPFQSWQAEHSGPSIERDRSPIVPASALGPSAADNPAMELPEEKDLPRTPMPVAATPAIRATASVVAPSVRRSERRAPAFVESGASLETLARSPRNRAGRDARPGKSGRVQDAGQG